MTGLHEGRVALVTGGPGGAGRAICERFEAEGPRSTLPTLPMAARLARGPRPAWIRLDVTRADRVHPGYVDTPMLQQFFPMRL